MVKDGPWIVLPEEYDQPPPSKLSLGGEGDVALGQMGSFPFVISMLTAPITDITTQVLLASSQINPSRTFPWVRISGSGGAVNLTSNPQMTAGVQGQVQTVQCVSNNVTLDDGTGLDLGAQGVFTMGSGAVITFVYTTAGAGQWVEIYRDRL
jgi:hypothetical protein